MAVVLSHDLEAFNPANTVLDMHSYTGQLLILFTLRLSQFPAARLAVRYSCAAAMPRVQVFVRVSGGCNRTRTCDPLIKSQL